MGGKKKTKGRGRQNQSRNKNHNQAVKHPEQSSDQHSDTERQENTIDKEDASFENSNNEDSSAHAVGSQEIVNQNELDAKEDNKLKEESCIKDCSISKDVGAAVSEQIVSPHKVLNLLKPDENLMNDHEQNQMQKQGTINGQTTVIRHASNESSPLKSTVEQKCNQNITDDQLQKGSLHSLVSQHLFAQITASCPYKRELEEYSPHKRDKRPIKHLRIEPDCKIEQHEVMQEQESDKCQKDRLSLDEQEHNKELQEDFPQLCSQGVQDDTESQLGTVKMHEVHHTGEDEFYNIEKNQRFADQQKQQYDARQNQEAEVKDEEEFESKKEHVVANQDEGAKENEKTDTMQNNLLHVTQEDATKKNEEICSWGTEWCETKQSECFDFKHYEQLSSKFNEELVVKQKEEFSTQKIELEAMLSENLDLKQVEQVHTTLNAELFAKESGCHDKLNAAKKNEHASKQEDEIISEQDERIEYELNVKVDAEQNKESIGRLDEVLDGKIGEHDKHDGVINEELHAKQNEHLDVKHNDRSHGKVDGELLFPDQKEWLENLREELDAKKNETTIAELCKELNVKVKEQNNARSCDHTNHDFKRSNELDMRQNEKFDVKINDVKVSKGNKLKAESYAEKDKDLDIRNDNAERKEELVRLDKEHPGKKGEQCVVHRGKLSFVQRGKLVTKEIVTFGIKEGTEVDIIQNEALNFKQNEDHVDQIPRVAEQSEPVDASAKDEVDAKEKDQHTTSQNDKVDDKQSIHMHGKEIEQGITKCIDHINAQVHAKQIEEFDDQQNEQVCEKPSGKFVNVEADIERSKESDVKLVQVKDAMQNEELDEQKELFTVQGNEKLEGNKAEQLDAKKIDKNDDKQNQQLNVKQEKIDVSGKMHSKGLEDMYANVNYVEQDDHYNSRQNEEFIVGNDGQHHIKNYVKENEDLVNEHAKNLNRQIEDTDLQQYQEINFSDKQEQDCDYRQEQELDGKHAKEIDIKQAQEFETKQDQELEAKDMLEVDILQNQKELYQGKPLSRQVDNNALKEEGKIESDKVFDIKPDEKSQNGGEDHQLRRRKRNEFCDIEKHVNQQQGEKQECEPEKKDSQLECASDDYLNSMIKTESQNSFESNKNLKQEDSEFIESASENENHKDFQNCGLKHSDCRSQPVDRLSVEQNEVCHGKQTKTTNSKEYEEHYESKEANILHVDGLITQQQENIQESDFDEENPDQDHLLNSLQHGAKEELASQEKSLINEQRKQLNELVLTNGHQGSDTQESRMESPGQDEQNVESQSHEPSDQQSEVMEINPHKSGTQENGQELQNNLSLEEHQSHASGQTGKDDKESKQEVKQDVNGEKKSFYKHGSHQSASKQDHVVRGNRSDHYFGKRQYYPWKCHQVGYNNYNYDSYSYQNTQNYQKGYQHEHQRKRDQNHQRAHRRWQNNQSHCQQQQTKPHGTSQSGGLTCGLCEDKYNHRTRRPRNLYCGHSLCTSCAQKLVKYSTIQCPYCKVKTLRVYNVDKLSVNFPLMDFLPDEATAKPVEPVRSNVETENEAHSTEVGAAGDQQCQSSLRHAEKPAPAVRSSEPMGQQFCDLNRSTGGGHSPPKERSPHGSRCLEAGVHPTAHCAGCEQWVCDPCGKIDHPAKKGCALIPVKETFTQMKQEKENNLKAIDESFSRSLREIGDYSDQLDVLLLSMGAAFECLGKEQQCTRKTLQEGLEMRKELEFKLPLVNDLPELIVYFQAVEKDCAATRNWLSDASTKAIKNDQIKKAGKELTSITLQSLMTSTAENGLVSQIVACQETPSGKKFSELTVDGGRMHLHSLSGITRLKEARTLPLECFKVCLDSNSTLAYLDLFWEGSVQGRVYIRMTGNTVRGRQFLSLCTGERGPTLRNTHFHRVWWKDLPGEHIWGGDYDQGDGSGGEGLADSEEAENELACAVPITPGVVGGRYEKENVSSIFRIYTREIKQCMEEAAFGRVEHGLAVVEKAIGQSNVQDVIISDCGIVIEV